uniref:Uncharacterized protein n=1 Tax=viral metagenome TaxID=1070528 RepID=A0A6C0KSV7_9ZZZZ
MSEQSPHRLFKPSRPDTGRNPLEKNLTGKDLKKLAAEEAAKQEKLMQQYQEERRKAAEEAKEKSKILTSAPPLSHGRSTPSVVEGIYGPENTASKSPRQPRIRFSAVEKQVAELEDAFENVSLETSRSIQPAPPPEQRPSGPRPPSRRHGPSRSKTSSLPPIGGKKSKKTLEKCTVVELKERAAKRKINVTGLKKDDIIAKLRGGKKK